MVQAVAGGRSTPPPPLSQDYLHHHYYHHDETSSTYTSPYQQHHCHHYCHHRRIVPVQGHTAMETPGGSCDGKGRTEASGGRGVEGKGKESGSVPWNQEARGQGGGESDGGQGGEGEVGGEGGSGEGNPVIRLLVLGGHAVGKSAITVRYLTRRFIGEYKSQVDIIYRQAIQMDDLHVDLEIVDISSRPGDNTLPTMEICQCDCYLVVYSVAERHTFLTANQLLHAIFRLRPNCPRPPITLLGNKQDLEHSRQVSAEEGVTTSTVFGCDFAEVSVAETSEDIVPVFTSLIRRARAATCLCPLSPASRCTALSSPLPPICRHVDGQRCRLCFYRGKELRDWGILRTASLCRALGGAENGVAGAARKEEDRCRRRNSRNHNQAARSLSSPLQKTISVPPDDSEKDASLEPQLGLPISNTPTETEHRTPPLIRQSASVTGKENVDRNIKGSPGHVSLVRSLSSPGGWSEEELSNEEENSHPTDRLITDSTNVFTNLKAQASTLPLLTRGRSFIMDSLRRDKSPECYCAIQGRTRSFKSSGKVEIVTLKRTEIKQNNKDETNRLLPGRGPSTHHDSFPSKAFANKLLKRDTNASHRDRLEEKQPSTLSLPAASKAPRSPRWLPIDSMDNSLEEGCHSPNSARQRKFSVFGVGRALGNFLSKGSLPDLPRATANICDKFGSLKRTIKKRSV